MAPEMLTTRTRVSFARYIRKIFRKITESRLAGPDTENLLDSPKVLQEVQAARSAEVRLESLAKLGKELLSDLPGYEEVSAQLSSALKDAEERRRDLIESWVIVYASIFDTNCVLHSIASRSRDRSLPNASLARAGE